MINVQKRRLQPPPVLALVAAFLFMFALSSPVAFGNQRAHEKLTAFLEPPN
ncbi:MAG TPA: hypothetical protein VH330_11085 [Candidatus Udaeobacter sp.]